MWNNLPVLKCPTCSLVWRADFNLPADFYKTIEVDAETGKKEMRRKNTQNQIETLKKFLPASGIFDLGSGDGTFLSELRGLGYTDCVGIEPGQNGLQISKERKLDVYQGTITNLPQVSNGKKVQMVTLFHLLEHLDDPRGSIETIRKSLDPKGILVLETPDADAPLQRITDHKNHLVYPEHLFYWNEVSVRKLLEQAGFSVVAVKHRSFNWQEAPILRSLLRLGVATGKTPNKTQVKNSAETVSANQNQLPSKHGFFRSTIRTILAYTVHLLKRDDYILVIARPRSGVMC